MPDHSGADIAATFFLDDIRGARVPSGRLRVILERVVAGGSLTVFEQGFLQQSGYEALRQFALGEISMEACCKRAREEQKVRLAANAAARKSEEAENARREDAAERKHAVLLAAQEAARERRRELRELLDRYGLRFIEKSDFQRVLRILRSVDGGLPIEKDDFVWLGAGRAEYLSAELRKAHHGNVAKDLSDEWARTKDVWSAINACGHWRKAEAPEKGRVIAEEALDRVAKNKKHRSALLTTGGGALRDLRRHSDAVRFGEEAHLLTPKDFRPCTLLGAVHIERGAYAEGAEWYEKAEARGASREMIDRDVQSIIDAAAPKERESIKKALKSYDDSRYRWD